MPNEQASLFEVATIARPGRWTAPLGGLQHLDQAWVPRPLQQQLEDAWSG